MPDPACWVLPPSVEADGCLQNLLIIFPVPFRLPILRVSLNTLEWLSAQPEAILTHWEEKGPFPRFFWYSNIARYGGVGKRAEFRYEILADT